MENKRDDPKRTRALGHEDMLTDRGCLGGVWCNVIAIGN